jgi:hypothetical protein
MRVSLPWPMKRLSVVLMLAELFRAYDGGEPGSRTLRRLSLAGQRGAFEVRIFFLKGMLKPYTSMRATESPSERSKTVIATISPGCKVELWWGTSIDYKGHYLGCSSSIVSVVSARRSPR